MSAAGKRSLRLSPSTWKRTGNSSIPAIWIECYSILTVDSGPGVSISDLRCSHCQGTCFGDDRIWKQRIAIEEARGRLGLYSRLWRNERCRVREYPIVIILGSIHKRIQVHQTPKTGSKRTTFLKNFNKHTRKISRLSKSSALIFQGSLVVCQGFRSTVHHEDLR